MLSFAALFFFFFSASCFLSGSSSCYIPANRIPTLLLPSDLGPLFSPTPPAHPGRARSLLCPTFAFEKPFFPSLAPPLLLPLNCSVIFARNCLPLQFPPRLFVANYALYSAPRPFFRGFPETPGPVSFLPPLSPLIPGPYFNTFRARQGIFQLSHFDLGSDLLLSPYISQDCYTNKFPHLRLPPRISHSGQLVRRRGPPLRVSHSFFFFVTAMLQEDPSPFFSLRF